MTAKVGSLNVDLTIETARFQKGLAGASAQVQGIQGKFAGLTKGLGGLAAAFAGGAVISGISGLASNAFEMASALSESAAQVGVSVEALQELRFAAEQSGIGADKMEATIKRLNKSLGDLQLGSKPAVEAFAAIGLSADDLRGKSPEKALGIIADALNKLPDASQRVAIGQQLMGRSFSDLLPLINGGSKAINDFAAASRENGQVSTEDAARLDELADNWDKLKTRVGVATANILSSTIHWLDETAAAQNKFKANVNSVYAAIGDAIAGIGKRLSDFFAIGRDMVLGLAKGIRDNAVAVWEALKGVVTSGITRAKSLLGIHSPSLVFQEIGNNIGEGLALGIEGSAARVAAATAKLTGAARNAAQPSFAGMTPGQGMAGGLDAISGPSTAAADAAGGNPIDQVTPKTEEWQERLSALQGTFGRLGGKFGELASSMVGAISGLINPAIDSSISKFQQMQNAMQGITGLLQSIFGKKVGGILGIGLQLFSAFSGSKIPGFATGTNFAPGGLAMVGERGPELVNLPRGSRVTPNNELGGSGRGGVVVNINAKDAVLTHQVRQWVAEGMAIAIDKGGDVGVQRMGYKQTRRVA